MPLQQADVEHLLRRVGFGATPSETAHFVGRELSDVLDEMLAKRPPAPAMPAVVTRPLWWDCKTGTSDWWIDRMAAASWVGSAAPSPLVEKLALFWHSHFACGSGKARDFRGLWRQLVAYWQLGLGDLEDLVETVMLDGSMLVYFDNISNAARRPQENLARELMELHTCGVGNFTEGDVIEMARAWTGHGVVKPFGSSVDHRHRFRRKDHDSGSKQLFGLAARNWDGPDTIGELVKGAKQAETARFIVGKLWRYYVDSSPTDTDIAVLAEGFVADGMRIDALLRALWSHDRFWAPGTRWAMIRQPIDWGADVLRRFDIPAADSHLSWLSRFMGQELFNPPNVAGWGTNAYWISTTAVWGKARFLKSIREHPNVRAEFDDLGYGSRSAGVARILDAFGVTEPTHATVSRLGEWFDDITSGNQKFAAEKDAVYIGGLLPEVQAS